MPERPLYVTELIVSVALAVLSPMDGFHQIDNVSPVSTNDVPRSCTFVERFDFSVAPIAVETERLASRTSGARPEVAGVASSTDDVLNLKVTWAVMTTLVDWPAGRHIEIVLETICNGAAVVE